jgi:hypothetical protein
MKLRTASVLVASGCVLAWAAASSADTAARPPAKHPSTWKANPDTSYQQTLSGNPGDDVELGFDDMFLYSIGFWEKSDEPCGFFVGGIKLESGKWKLGYKEAVIGKCEGGNQGKNDLRSLKLEPPFIPSRWDGKLREDGEDPNLVRWLRVWRSADPKHPENERLKGLQAWFAKDNLGVLEPRDKMVEEKRANAFSLEQLSACNDGHAVKKVILKKGREGAGRNTFVGLRAVCAAVLAPPPPGR